VRKNVLVCLLAGLPVLAADMREMIERYTADHGSLSRFYVVAGSPVRSERFRRFNAGALEQLRKVDFASLDHEGQVDYVLFQNHLNRELRRLDLEAKSLAETAPLLPFAPTVIELEESRRRMEPVDPEKTAALLSRLAKQVDETQAAVKPESVKKTVANRAAGDVLGLKETLKHWFTFYNGYDPVFTWWMAQPYKNLDQALTKYAAFLKEKVVGVNPEDKDAIIGNPVGREALVSELGFEMIPYSPEELIAIANKEFAWCDAEIRKASRELGYGDDWHKALEHVKNLHVEPGKQPTLIRDLALEATDYVEKHDLVTVPPLAKETWHMEMMTPERQLVNPFFLGGEVIQVSYPTDTMTQDQKMMSMRGNNIHFSRSTVFHELIPGHHLQAFMNERYHPYRELFRTPFWTEGWALYWEMLLWDMNFPKTPENRIGMLFWRMHRCARIVFSLSFHLEQWTPQQCIDFLVDRVGHERDNATAEVRRSFNGDYPPLYQAGYMLGGLQFRALHRELVESGKMTNRAFHDAILKENRMPVEMVRAILTNAKLTRDFKSAWRFDQAGLSSAAPGGAPRQ
jgi:uncharacterized protein (DUF885 family)